MSKRVNSQIGRTVRNSTRKTYLIRVLDLVRSGHDAQYIGEWCERMLAKEGSLHSPETLLNQQSDGVSEEPMSNLTNKEN